MIGRASLLLLGVDLVNSSCHGVSGFLELVLGTISSILSTLLHLLCVYGLLVLETFALRSRSLSCQSLLLQGVLV